MRSMVSDSCESPEAAGGWGNGDCGPTFGQPPGAAPPGGGAGQGMRVSADGGGGADCAAIGGADSGWCPVKGDCVVTVGGCAGAAPNPEGGSCCPQPGQNWVPGCTEFPHDGHHELSIPTIVPFGSPLQASRRSPLSPPERRDRAVSAKPRVRSEENTIATYCYRQRQGSRTVRTRSAALGRAKGA
jgi:hypothetical protein